MRPAGVRVAGTLDDREASLIEDRLKAGEPGMQAERLARRIRADLQNLRSRHGDPRTTAEVKRVRIRDHRIQRVVPTGEINDDEVARHRALRARDVDEE